MLSGQKDRFSNPPGAVDAWIVY